VGGINHVFVAGALSDISYPTTIDADGTLDSSAPVPPLKHPEAELVEVDDWDAPEPPELPEMDVEEDPEWVPIERRDFEPVALSLAELDLEFEYEPPEIEPLAGAEEIKYEDDEDLRDRIKAILRQQDQEVTKWRSVVTQEVLLSVALRGRKEKVSKEIERAFEGAAARNISLPYGGLDAAVDELSQAELDERYTAIQTVRNEVYEASTNVMVSAVQRALQIERNHFQLFLRYARQELQIYKLNLQLATTAYESVVQIYEKLVQLYNMDVEAYNQYMSAQQAQNEAYGQQASLTQAETQSFLARVQAYSSRISVKRAATEAVSVSTKLKATPVQAYAAQLKADVANLDIVEQNISAFRTAIKAHGDSTKWYDDALGAYEAWVTAKSSAIDVNAASVQAYSKLWGAEEKRMSAYSDYVSQSMSHAESALNAYKAAVSTQREYFSGLSQAASSTMRAIKAYEGAVRDAQAAVREGNSAQISYQAAMDTVAITEAKKELAQQSINAEAYAQSARLRAAKAAASMVAAGALAQAGSTMVQSSVSTRGTASESVSGQHSDSYVSSMDKSTSWRSACRETTRYSQNAPT
jgi:hypothetical protein